MFIGHVESIVHQLIEIVLTDLLIAHINFSIESREFNIDPIRVLRFCLEERSVLHHPGIYGIFECIGIAWSIELLVFMFWEIDPEIAFFSYGIITVAGDRCHYHPQHTTQHCYGRYSHKIDSVGLHYMRVHHHFHFPDPVTVYFLDDEFEIAHRHHVIHFGYFTGLFEDQAGQ